LRVFENGVKENKQIEEGWIGGWRKLHNEQHHDLFSPNTISMITSRWMRWVKDVAYMGQKRNACRVLVGKPEGKRLIRSHRCR
jgi:hypothetical protein